MRTARERGYRAEGVLARLARKRSFAFYDAQRVFAADPEGSWGVDCAKNLCAEGGGAREERGRKERRRVREPREVNDGKVIGFRALHERPGLPMLHVAPEFHVGRVLLFEARERVVEYVGDGVFVGHADEGGEDVEIYGNVDIVQGVVAAEEEHVGDALQG